ncbi:MAG: hypothetical protein LBE31_07755, partial [Deltaproteobacteria bacterium]|nr:hypothetical protein [Deltaproteobacteria bacterium]
MPFDSERLNQLLNEASVNLVMLSSDNLLEISNLLGLVEQFEAAFAPLGSPIPKKIIDALIELLTAAIRDEVPDVPSAMELAGHGLSLLDELVRCLPVEAPFQGDSEGFLKKVQALIYSQATDTTQEPSASPKSLDSGGKLTFQPRKKGSGVAFIVPTPTQVRRDMMLSTQKLTVDYFKDDFVGALEDLQMKLVSVEQKSDPVSALHDTLPRFRAILGGLSLLDLDDLARLIADTIGLIDYVISEQVPHTTMVTDILLKACSLVISGLNTLQINPDGRTWSIKPAWSQSEMASLRENLWAARQGILTPSSLPVNSGAVTSVKPKKLGEILVEKGLISQGDLGGLIQAQKTVRSVRLGEILLQENLISPEELNQALERQQGEDKGRRLGEILVTMGLLEHEHIDKALKIQESMKETKLGEIILKQKIGAPDKVAAALREQKQSEGPIATSGAAVHTVKVETLKLDGLIDLVGELVITQSLITSNESIKFLKEQKINKDLAQVSRITSELQRNAMSLRMVQINQTFRKMNRLVRDLANRFEKDVDFVTTGDDTEIDRNMVESLYDPLVHM